MPPPHYTAARRALVATALIGGVALAHAQYVATPPALRALPPLRPSEGKPRSLVLDPEAAALARISAQPLYFETIVVQGVDTETSRKRGSVEQRFAASLLAPSPAAAAGIRPLNATPCYAVQSSLNTIGTSFAPLSGCP